MTSRQRGDVCDELVAGGCDLEVRDEAAAVTELVASRAMLGTYEKVAGFLSGSSGANAMEAGGRSRSQASFSGFSVSARVYTAGSTLPPEATIATVLPAKLAFFDRTAAKDAAPPGSITVFRV